jgi:hypothetical protein
MAPNGRIAVVAANVAVDAVETVDAHGKLVAGVYGMV